LGIDSDRGGAAACTGLQLPVSPSSKGETVVVLGELVDSRKTSNEQLRRWPENE
jgi:hypothetical protein